MLLDLPVCLTCGHAAEDHFWFDADLPYEGIRLRDCTVEGCACGAYSSLALQRIKREIQEN